MSRLRSMCRVLLAAGAAAGLAAPAAVADTIVVGIASSSDDAEQNASYGSMSLTSSDIELIKSGFTNQVVGLRFTGISIPQGATIDSAYIQFTVDETGSTSTNLTIKGEDTDSASTFTTSSWNISGRTTTTASVAWSPPSWPTVGASGAAQQTPDIATVIQEIVDRAGWTSGNDLAIIITGSGVRTAESYDTSAAQAAELHVTYTVASGGGGGAGGTYVEAYQTWSATSSNTWQTKDLSGAPYNVPANAVVEIAVRNTDTFNARYGGVRAYGSSLERRVDLSAAPSGGAEHLVMHVQADASSRIKHYAESTATVKFDLLGWWTAGTYVERMDTIVPSSSNTWYDLNLSGYGVGAEEVAEIVLSNDDWNYERLAGVRTNGSSLSRRLDLVKTRVGGDSTGTMFVQADATANATIEAYAQDTGDVRFRLVGYWTSPPGTYTEAFADAGSPTLDLTWQDKDLSGSGVPAGATAEVSLVNAYAFAENHMGVRENGSSLARLLDVQEAESGGHDAGRMHVNADSASTIEMYHEDVSETHYFYLTGWWELGGDLLLVVGDAASPSAEDQTRRTEFQSLGWSVALIDDDADQATFAAAVADSRVAYVSETASPGSLGTKLTDVDIGVLVEERGSYDAFGVLSADGSGYSGTQIDVTSTGHYITATLAAGNRTIVSSTQPLNSTTLSAPRSALVIAEEPSSAAKALFGVDWCEDERGLRVLLPWGGSGFDMSELAADGVTILDRSLTWATSKVAHWRLNESSGTTATDASGNGYDATLTLMGGTEWTDGRILNGLHLDGVNDHLVASDVAVPSDAFTFALWFKPDADLTSSDPRADFIYGVSTPRPYLSFNKNGGGEIGLFVKVSGSSYSDITTTTTSWSASSWHHVAFTWDGTDFRVYVDGAQEGSAITHAGTHDACTGFHIGRRASDGADPFAGLIDDVRIYSVALGPDEIQALYEACGAKQIISWKEVDPDS